MQVKGPNDDKHLLGPKSKLSNIVFFCFTNCSPQVCFYRHRPSLLHPHIICALHTLSVPSTYCLCHPHIVCAVHTLSASFVPSTRHLYPPYVVCALHTSSVPSIHHLCPPYIICALHTSSVPFTCCLHHLCPPHVVCALHTSSVPFTHHLCPSCVISHLFYQMYIVVSIVLHLNWLNRVPNWS